MTKPLLIVILCLLTTSYYCVAFSVKGGDSHPPLHGVDATDDSIFLPTDRHPEVSRRVALISAAALVAGASPAYSKSLEQQATALERNNIANSNGAPEKHLPTVTVEGSSVEIVVPHVMDAEKPHYIQYVWLKDMKADTIVAIKEFQATDGSPPTLATTVPKSSTYKALLYCNLHGLWEGESFAV